jgi:hypothetical protein
MELDEHKIRLVRVDHRYLQRDLSLCWHDTQLMSNAVQKVKLTLLEMFELFGRRPDWAANGRVPRWSVWIKPPPAAPAPRARRAAAKRGAYGSARCERRYAMAAAAVPAMFNAAAGGTIPANKITK